VRGHTFVSRMLALSLMIANGPCHAESSWPDNFLGRVETLALMQSLNAALLSGQSATTVLETWCADHKMADDPKLHAKFLSKELKPMTSGQRQRLEIGDDEAVKYRQVELSCGPHIFSRAENWYVPARLTPEMNQILDTTDAPFGRVVRDLLAYRQTFAVEMFWHPLPEGWEGNNPSLPVDGPMPSLPIPEALFQHQALVLDKQRKPFAEVRETYTREILAFPAPH
jgi:chorismate-pyruvate lyase